MKNARRHTPAPNREAVAIDISDPIVLEPFTYHEDFESRMLGGWASYPLWQDTAYDPNFRVHEMVPGDPNLSIVQKVTPYTHVDNYGGAQKLFDIYLVDGSEIIFRYFLKTHLPVEYLKVRLAAGTDGKIDCTIPHPSVNRWEWVTATFDDFIREHPSLAGRDRLKVNALAILAKVPNADPAMPFYLGLDEVTIRAKRPMEFQFAEPSMYRLSEWKPYIPKKQYHRGDSFTLAGRWPLDAGRVELSFAAFTDPSKILKTVSLKNQGGRWAADPFTLTFAEGLYLNTLRAYKDNQLLSETPFTLHIVPKGMAGNHPRLWFDREGKKQLEARLKSDKFKKVDEEIAARAVSEREKLPVDNLVYDLDQYPDEDWLPTWSAWGTHLYPTGEAVYWNALAYTFHGDRIAGEYAKEVLLKLASFKDWTHPWLTQRGMFSEHRKGSWSHRIALAYDLTYELMSEDERQRIRLAIVDHAVRGAHITYVVNDNVASNTSNWVAHIVGGSLMLQAAIFGDGPEVEYLEPFFTGAAMKVYDMLSRTVDPDGAWGEGLGYHNYTFQTLSQSLPALIKVFNIDFSKPLEDSYREYLWAGPLKDKQYFYFGDTGGELKPIANWAWLLDRTRDPLLGWYYHFLRCGDHQSNTAAQLHSSRSQLEERGDFMEVLYDPDTAPRRDPFDEEPVKLFRNVGTTVFKSGWNPEDFIFVMRTGPFYNHQHLDQGSFWLSFNRSVFIAERRGSTYYEDPLYQPWYTQPVGHSTILLDGNHQSQRVGDPLTFAGGFEDYAHVTHFLNGRDAAFVSGDIGRLYWGKVQSLKRNVLYLKPHTVLMLDTAVPAGVEVEVTLLYQAPHLEDIRPNPERSTITRDGNALHLMHLYPEGLKVAAVETPHYLGTLNNQRPLAREGMLTVTARTAGIPLVIANLLTGTNGETPDYAIHPGDGYVAGTIGNIRFAFSTRPGRIYETDGIATDAAALTFGEKRLFAALCTTLSRDGKLIIASAKPVTCEITNDEILYYHDREVEVRIGVPAKSTILTINDIEVTSCSYEGQRKVVALTLPAGEGTIRFEPRFS